MTKEQIIRKFTSRKFLLTLIANLAAIIAIIVGDNAIVGAVAGLAIAVVNAVYCVIEGKLDAASMKAVSDAAAQTAGALGAEQSTVDKIGAVGGVVSEMVGNAVAPGAEETADTYCTGNEKQNE